MLLTLINVFFICVTTRLKSASIWKNIDHAQIQQFRTSYYVTSLHDSNKIIPFFRFCVHGVVKVWKYQSSIFKEKNSEVNNERICALVPMGLISVVIVIGLFLFPFPTTFPKVPSQVVFISNLPNFTASVMLISNYIFPQLKKYFDITCYISSYAKKTWNDCPQSSQPANQGVANQPPFLGICCCNLGSNFLC